MAKNGLKRIPMLSFMVFVVLAISSEATKYQSQNLKETNIVFYMHDLASGLNGVTTKMVGGIPHKRWSVLSFGTVFATDDKLTETKDWNSTQVGRARGIYVNSALDGSDLHLLMSLVFTNKDFNGSTLEIQGSDRFYQKCRDVSVVSGTGIFRLARGFSTLETVFLDISKSNALIRWNVTVLHYRK